MSAEHSERSEAEEAAVRVEGEAASAAEGQQVPAPEPSAGSFLSVPKPKGSIEKIPVVGFLWDLYRGYSRRNGPLFSAGIAYYALFSVGPLILLTLQITGRLLGSGPPSAEVRLATTLSEYLGQDLAAMLASVVRGVTASTTSSYTFAIVGLGILLYGATRLFVRLQVSFNYMWDVRVVSRTFSWRRLMSRLLVFGLILIPTLLLMAALVLSTAVTWLDHLVDRSSLVVTIAGAVIPFLVSWLALLIVYVVLPDIHLRIRDCWFTAFLVAVSWSVVTRVFSIYLSWTGSQKYAGAVGALIGVIFWVDILAIAALLGARFNKAIYVWRGKTIEPYYFAAPILELPEGETEAAAQPAGSANQATGSAPPGSSAPPAAAEPGGGPPSADSP